MTKYTTITYISIRCVGEAEVGEDGMQVRLTGTPLVKSDTLTVHTDASPNLANELGVTLADLLRHTLLHKAAAESKLPNNVEPLNDAVDVLKGPVN